MVSKELITVYKCDRCGKQMDSQYAILTLKRAGESLSGQDFVNQDLCVDCFDKISLVMEDSKAMIVHTESSWTTIKDSTIINSLGYDKLDLLNKHLDSQTSFNLAKHVTCV